MTAARAFGVLCIFSIIAQACATSGMPEGVDKAASDAGSDVVRVAVDSSTTSPSDTPDAGAQSSDQDAPDADAAKPEGPASVAPCMTGGNVLYVDGDPTDPVHPGQETIAGAATTFVNAAPTSHAFTTRLWTEFVPAAPNLKHWELIFSTDKLSTPISTGVYASAQRHTTGGAGHPGLFISNYDLGCSGALTGSFEIVELTMNGPDVTSFTASFEQQCAGMTGALRGCVHVGP